jgi:RNA polymerase sigma-70 factor, ECF subfamily
MPDDEPRRDDDLLLRIEGGDEAAMTELFTRHRERLRQMIRMRIDRRLQEPVDSSDVLEDAYLEIARRAREYVDDPDLPPFVWLHALKVQALQARQRKHLEPHTPVVWPEVPLPQRTTPQANAAMLLGQLTPPDRAALSAEMLLRIEEALNAMKPVDLEILALRHVQELNNSQTSQVLGMTNTTTSNRYMRAQGRLRKILKEIPGLLDELGPRCRRV